MVTSRFLTRCSLAGLALALFAVTSWSGEVVGWRTDGTGAYPKAQPPLEWSADKNVVWRTKMPGMSNSLPVLVGERIFICSEPATLLCLHREDGRILWQKTCTYADLGALPPEVQERFDAEKAEAGQLSKQQGELDKEGSALRKKLKAEPEAKEEIQKQLDVLRKKGDALREQKKKLTTFERYTRPGTHPTAGYTSPTPVTNGREVFVLFGDGLAACFDLEGNRKWLKLIEHSIAAFAHSASPVLAGDKLIVHYTDLVALNVKDGSESWRVKRSPSHGSPVVTRIGDADIILTPSGAMSRASDGELLTNKLGSCGSNSPLLQNGCVYYVRNEVKAFRLPTSLSTPLKVEQLWKANIKGGGYWFSSPVLHGGLLYAANDQGLLSALEADTGKVVYEQRVHSAGSTYPSLSAAGDRIYLSNDQGMTTVIQAGREYKMLARNKLDTFRSSLVFEGKRLYLRTYTHLYCIGE